MTESCRNAYHRRIYVAQNGARPLHPIRDISGRSR